MSCHTFMLFPGTWFGEGVILLSYLQETLPYFMRWHIDKEEGELKCVQEIQIKGYFEKMVSYFYLSEKTENSFFLLIENHAIGRVKGNGIISESTLGWEFRDEAIGFEGFEVYTKQSEEAYDLHGEFLTKEQLRTIIRGKIWKKFEGPKDAHE